MIQKPRSVRMMTRKGVGQTKKSLTQGRERRTQVRWPSLQVKKGKRYVLLCFRNIEGERERERERLTCVSFINSGNLQWWEKEERKEGSECSKEATVSLHAVATREQGFHQEDGDKQFFRIWGSQEGWWSVEDNVSWRQGCKQKPKKKYSFQVVMAVGA